MIDENELIDNHFSKEEKVEVKRKQISFSEIQLWRTCQHKYYLNKTLKIKEPKNDALAFGSALHETIEDILNKNVSRMLFKKIFQEKFKKEIEGVETKLDPISESIIAEKIFNHLNFYKNFAEYDIFSVEEEILVPIDKDENGETIYYIGYVDLILKHKTNGTYLIIDWKTALKKWNIAKKKEDKFFFGQLALYKHFISLKHNIPFEKIDTKFVTLIKNDVDYVEQFKIEISDSFLKFVLDTIYESIKQISISKQTNVYQKTKNLKGIECKECKYCYFKDKPEYCSE